MDDNLTHVQLFPVKMVDYYFDKIVKFFSIGVAPEGYTTAHMKQLALKETYY